MKGQCDYTEIECWFSHTETVDSVKSKFECSFCGENFDFHSDLKFHKKKQHRENVPMCREEIENCHFGEKCWFLHISNGMKWRIKMEKIKITLKNFDMVEKFRNRIILLENRMNGQMI